MVLLGGRQNSLKKYQTCYNTVTLDLVEWVESIFSVVNTTGLKKSFPVKRKIISGTV